MIATSYRQFLDGFGVQRSYSRPRVSNDNPFSEAINKTLKYSPPKLNSFARKLLMRQWRVFELALQVNSRRLGLVASPPGP